MSEARVTSDRSETTPAARTWRQLRAAHDALTITLEHGLAPLGITPLQLSILRALHTSPGPLTIGQLGRALALTQQAMTLMMDRVEQRGWVRRVRDLPDRRTIRVELTAAGQAKLVETLPVEAAIIEAMFGRLTPAEVTTLTGLLERLVPSAAHRD